jgi:hypothetical protein
MSSGFSRKSMHGTEVCLGIEARDMMLETTKLLDREGGAINSDQTFLVSSL